MTSLAIQESRINQATQAFFVEVGDAFRLIRDERLYKNSYSNFEDYCKERWGYSKRHVNRLCEGAGIWHQLESSDLVSILPTTERQVRNLTPIDLEQRIEAWTDAVEASAAGQPTVTEVQQAVKRVQQRAQWTIGSSAVVDTGPHKGKVVEVVEIQNNGSVIQGRVPDLPTSFPFLAGELSIIEVAPTPEPTPKSPTLRERNQALKSLLLKVLTEAMMPPELQEEVKLALAE
ncbi:MAG: hypothetical protein AAGI45_19470 [Cyanobacteria bacterium P01_H01_bin.26]